MGCAFLAVLPLWSAGALASPVELGFMVATSVWTVYYLETQPVCALLAAAGVWLVIAAIGRRGRRTRDAATSREPGARFAGWCMLALSVLAIMPTRDAVRMVSHFKSIGDLPHRLFQNSPPLATAQTWIVNNRGVDGERLLRAAPDRIPYLFDFATKTMQPLPAYTKPAQ